MINLIDKTNPMSKTRKLTISSVVIALYICLMFLTQSFAFGQYQIRIATSIYSLAGIYPFLIVPLGLGNLFSNLLMGGLGPLDMIGGLIVGIITSAAVYGIIKLKLNSFLIALPIIIFPTLLVPIWLSYLLHLPYLSLVVSLGIGQIIPGILGALLIRYLGPILHKM